MLTIMAVCDAYGAGFEFVDPDFIQQNHTLDKYVQHPKWPTVPGRYTDDTQMAIALAELLLARSESGTPLSTEAWTTSKVAFAFLRTFAQDPRTGYAKGFYKVMQACVAEGMETDSKTSTAVSRFLHIVRPHSKKNGGAMRAGVIGLLPDTEEVVDRAMMQASLTHATRQGMEAAAASALMVHYFHYRLGPKAELADFIGTHFPSNRWDGWRGPVGTGGGATVRAAITAIMGSTTLIDVLRHSVAFGGDTDTVAAIAGLAASRSVEIVQILPPSLHKGLERGLFGYEYLQDLDSLLLEMYPSPIEDYCDDDDLIGDLFDTDQM